MVETYRTLMVIASNMYVFSIEKLMDVQMDIKPTLTSLSTVLF